MPVLMSHHSIAPRRTALAAEAYQLLLGPLFAKGGGSSLGAFLAAAVRAQDHWPSSFSPVKGRKTIKKPWAFIRVPYI